MKTELELVDITKNVIQFYASLKIVYGFEDSNQIIFDEGNKIFALWAVPRSASTALEKTFAQRKDVAIIHIQIKENLLWINYDASEDSVAFRLENMGVPKKQIVLGYMTPEERLETDYAHV